MIDTYSFILGAMYATGFAFISGCLLLYCNKRKKKRIKFNYPYNHGTRMTHIRGNIMYPSIRKDHGSEQLPTNIQVNPWDDKE